MYFTYSGFLTSRVLMKSTADSDIRSKSSPEYVTFIWDIFKNVSCLSSPKKGDIPVSITYASTPMLLD